MAAHSQWVTRGRRRERHENGGRNIVISQAWRCDRSPDHPRVGKLQRQGTLEHPQGRSGAGRRARSGGSPRDARGDRRRRGNSGGAGLCRSAQQKRVHCFAGEAPAGCTPRLASWEIDRAEFVSLDEASRRILNWLNSFRGCRNCFSSRWREQYAVIKRYADNVGPRYR